MQSHRGTRHCEAEFNNIPLFMKWEGLYEQGCEARIPADEAVKSSYGMMRANVVLHRLSMRKR